METKPGLGRATLVFLLRRGKVFLALKKQKIGEGFLNGYGGGIEPGETPTQAIVREVDQECGLKLDPQWLIERGVVRFHNQKPKGVFICEVHMFVALEWTGFPRASEEMGKPKLFPVDNLPFQRMMKGDPLWLPYVLDLGKKDRINGDLHYGPGQMSVLKYLFTTEAGEVVSF